MNFKGNVIDCCEVIYELCNNQCALGLMDHGTMDALMGAVGTIAELAEAYPNYLVDAIKNMKNEEIIAYQKGDKQEYHLYCVKKMNQVVDLIRGEEDGLHN